MRREKLQRVDLLAERRDAQQKDQGGLAGKNTNKERQWTKESDGDEEELKVDGPAASVAHCQEEPPQRPR
jgi:hypothetical protein